MSRPPPTRRLTPFALAAALLLAATAASAEPAPAPAPAEPAQGAAEPSGSSTTFMSYGEITWNVPTHAGYDAIADLRRFVFGVEHRLNPRLKFVAEVEIEHAVSSATDAGEVEVEQAYVERQLGPTWALRAGLILIPIGLLNQNHEPTAYYGVERNFVETDIIPTTWREGGVEVVGVFESGLTLQAGLTTGFDVNKWDAASTEGQESPLGSIHQELSLAQARNVAAHAALDWRGVPGLQVGAALFVGGASQGQPGVPRVAVAIGDVHARWTPGRFDLSALYAFGAMSNTAAFNTPLVGNPTLVPRTFDGGYVQAAWRAWSHDGLALAPFARVERFNTGRSYADIGPGLTPEARPTETVLTAGLDFKLSPEVVLKADVQHFRVETSQSRIDFGLGWAF